MIEFPTSFDEINKRIDAVDPPAYRASRNYGNGAVSYLSPYISRGVISTKYVLNRLIEKGHSWLDCEKFIQELAWRDYWQLVWLEKGGDIFSDLKHAQEKVERFKIPTTLLEGKTGIDAVDAALKNFQRTGYLHNHMRMYIASIACNVGQYHWLQPAKWMYAHLLDGDLASNHLSWQWVAGSNAKKKYFANQENINRYFHSDQRGTFLDVAYEDFPTLRVPEVLKSESVFDLVTVLPTSTVKPLARKQTLVYNYYNIDPLWHVNENFQRVLLLEPEHFRKFPVSQHCIDFALKLGEQVPELVIFVGSFNDLARQVGSNQIVFKEHPTNSHYSGKKEERDWICSVKGYFPSFFGFWKKCKRELKSTCFEQD